MTERDEDRAFARFLAGRDPEALARVFDLTAPKLLLLAMHLVRDPAEAEDLVQTTFVHAITTADSFVAGRPVLPWLNAILAHRAQDIVRARVRRPRLGANDDTTPGRERDPAARILDAEAAQRIGHALDALREPYRTVLVLRLVHGLSAIEVAHALGKPPGTVRMQHQRALDLLRAALPRGLSVPAVLLVERTRGLAVVRREVLATVSTSRAAGAALVIGGIVMSKKLLLVAGALALASVGSALWIHGASASDVELDQAAHRHPPPDAGTRAARASDASALRRAIATAGTEGVEPGATEDGHLRVEPWLLRLRVLDEHGAPVARAEVSLRDGVPVDRVGLPLGMQAGVGRPGNSYQPPAFDTEPFARGRTQEDGTASFQLDRELVFFDVLHERAGHSGMLRAWHGDAANEALVTLRADVRLRGVVLRADETPATDVEVVAVPQGMNSLFAGPPPRPKPVRTDGQGRFELPVAALNSFRLRARDGDAVSHEVKAHASRTAPEVVLRFPGGIAIGGLLLRPDGMPTAGVLQAWEVVARGHVDRMLQQFRAEDLRVDGSGRFELVLPRHGEYQLVARADGFAGTGIVVVHVDDTTPRVERDLRLLPAVEIAGRVSDRAGRALAGASVRAVPAKGEHSAVLNRPQARDLFGGARAVVGEDGAFCLPGLHPLTGYHLLVTPDPKRPGVRTVVENVPPGTVDLNIVLDDEQIAGGALTLRVVDARRGTPIGSFAWEWNVSPHPGSSLMESQHGRVEDGDGRLVVRDLGHGREYRFLVSAAGYARAVVVVPMDARLVERTVELVAPATLAVVVLDAEGEPAADATVHVDARELTNMHVQPRPTGRDGTARIEGLPSVRVTVWATRGSNESAKREVDLSRGGPTDVELRMPR